MFLSGLTIGRVALLRVNETVRRQLHPLTRPHTASTQIGERYVIFLYVFLAIGLELIVWLVPSLIGGALAVSFVGLFLGPIYPILMNHCGRVIPPALISGAIGWIACWGAAGAAVFPFITGAIPSKAGIVSLLPV